MSQARWAEIEAAIAEIVAEHLMYDVDEFTLEDMERVNDSPDGWTVKLSAPMGNTLRIEGIRLSPAALRRVWEEARRMAIEAYMERCVQCDAPVHPDRAARLPGDRPVCLDCARRAKRTGEWDAWAERARRLDRAIAWAEAHVEESDGFDG